MTPRRHLVRAVAVAATLAPWTAARSQVKPTTARAATITGVVGKNLDSAVNALAWTKLVIVQIESVTTAFPHGTVVAQRPPGGTPLRAVTVDTLVWATASRRAPIGAVIRAATRGVPSPVASAASTAPPPAPTPADSGRGKRVSVVVPGLAAGLPGVVVREDTYVPQLIGRNAQTAAALLERAGLKQGAVARDYSDDIAAGLIFRQHPEYSRIPVARGTAVDIWFSLGPRPPTVPAIKVPGVIGADLARATLVLRKSRLRVGHVDTTYLSGGNGTIQHQRPDVGLEARVGDAVDLWITIAPQTVVVPNVTGLTRDSAERALKAKGFGMGRVTLVTTSARDTTIISQDPAANSDAAPGSLVDVVENRPQVVRRIPVPRLIGHTREDAARLLAEDSLFLGDVLVSGDSAGRVVAAQDPADGTLVFLHSAVNVTLQGPAVVAVDSQFARVPSVVNLTAELARVMLADSGFSNVSVVGDSATAAGIVASQRPPAGTLASPSSLVALTIAAPAGPAVPDLVGMSEAAARAEAGRHGLLMTVAARHRALRLRDAVARQSPAPPSLLPADNTISVDLNIPVVPPIPTAIVLAAAGIAASIRRKPEPPKPPPPTGTVRLTPVTRASPTPSLTTDAPTLVKHSIAMRYAARAHPWVVQPNDRSLIKPQSPPDA